MDRDEERELNYWAQKYGLTERMKAALDARAPGERRAAIPVPPEAPRVVARRTGPSPG